MTRPYVPQGILDAAHARSTARTNRDWAEADRLRSEIAAAGWRVIDRGMDFSLEPETPADVPDGDAVRYGSSGSVLSRQAEASSARATFILVAGRDSMPIETALGGVLAQRSERDQVLVVVDEPDPDVDIQLPPTGGMDEVLRTAKHLGAGAALNIALRRAIGDIVILIDGSVVPAGDIVAPLAAALADPTVAVIGLTGRMTADLRRYVELASAGDATTVAQGLVAFRRSDALLVGPADDSMIDPAHFDAWWSLVLRDGPEDSPGPRRAVIVPDLPVRRIGGPGIPRIDDPRRSRQAKRNFYRLLDRFRGRRDLLEPAEES